MKKLDLKSVVSKQFKIVAWSLSDDMTTENTVYKTWLKARKNREITNNHIFHSDRGVQYVSNKMTSIFSASSKN